MSQGLGLRLGKPFPVSNLIDHLFVSQETHWPDKPTVPWVSEPDADQLTVYYSDRDEERPLVVGAPVMPQDVSCWFFVALNKACAALAPWMRRSATIDAS